MPLRKAQVLFSSTDHCSKLRYRKTNNSLAILIQNKPGKKNSTFRKDFSVPKTGRFGGLEVACPPPTVTHASDQDDMQKLPTLSHNFCTTPALSFNRQRKLEKIPCRWNFLKCALRRVKVRVSECKGLGCELVASVSGIEFSSTKSTPRVETLMRVKSVEAQRVHAELGW
ncbi:hypothetical protein TNCV_127971 [Trichonephila clavipes]|nr:hypothetical protein TNCV_127971 [Trichonephila clavipes]